MNLHDPFDSNIKPFLQVQDLGTDPGPLNHTKVYNINITDYNYNDPEIVFPIAGKVIRLSQVIPS